MRSAHEVYAPKKGGEFLITSANRVKGSSDILYPPHTTASLPLSRSSYLLLEIDTTLLRVELSCVDLKRNPNWPKKQSSRRNAREKSTTAIVSSFFQHELTAAHSSQCHVLNLGGNNVAGRTAQGCEMESPQRNVLTSAFNHNFTRYEILFGL